MRGTQYYNELIYWIVMNVESDLLDFQDVRNDVKAVMIVDTLMAGDVDRVADDILKRRREMLETSSERAARKVLG